MIHCFYHSADLDGHCSGAIVKYRFPDAVMHPINYGDEFPWDEIKEEDEVYMVDFALQPSNLQERLFQVCRLHWIDHHKSAIESISSVLSNRILGKRDTTKAACELTWEYLFHARAEGIVDGGCLNCGESEPCGCSNPEPSARDSFAFLWNSINEKRGFGWHSNPYVWVISFKRVNKP